tara:strand:- start:1167 stop:2042 length:876 start_codon:yes stop_codon:yes gene_type:complete
MSRPITITATDNPFLPGFNVKPYIISATGEVSFTDGAGEIKANQLQCEAYGYTYDKASGTCIAYRPNLNLNSVFGNIDNNIEGAGNSTFSGTINTHILGENNLVKGSARNNRVTGISNQIANGINNTTVSGVLGEATASNSIVLGGNTSGDLLGERQFVRCLYGVQTTNNSTVASGINNETGVRFTIPDNSIVYFHADTIVVRVGGSSGSGAVGDYGSYVERGVIINKSGTCTIQRERDTIKTSGTVTNWRILAAVGASNTLSLTCRGQTDMTLEWCMNVNITQIKTGVAL